jgi:hypothetical protein
MTLGAHHRAELDEAVASAAQSAWTVARLAPRGGAVIDASGGPTAALLSGLPTPGAVVRFVGHAVARAARDVDAHAGQLREMLGGGGAAFLEYVAGTQVIANVVVVNAAVRRARAFSAFVLLRAHARAPAHLTRLLDVLGFGARPEQQRGLRQSARPGASRHLRGTCGAQNTRIARIRTHTHTHAHALLRAFWRAAHRSFAASLSACVILAKQTQAVIAMDADAPAAARVSLAATARAAAAAVRAEAKAPLSAAAAAALAVADAALTCWVAAAPTAAA